MKVKGSLDPLPKMVIYCQTKELSVSLHRLLRINASSAVAVYHASLTEETKKAVYEEFCHPGSQIRCLIATVAFGLVSFHHSRIKICSLSDIKYI